MPQEQKLSRLDRVAIEVEIDGERAARLSGSERSREAMKEIDDEMKKLTPQERIQVAKKVLQVNEQQLEKDGSLPKAKVGYTKDGQDVEFIEFDPPFHMKAMEAAAKAIGPDDGARMRDTKVYVNPEVRNQRHYEDMSGQNGSVPARQATLRELNKGSSNNQ
jgi:16S rRNA G966 N2-methylase RsmD